VVEHVQKWGKKKREAIARRQERENAGGKWGGEGAVRYFFLHGRSISAERKEIQG